MGVSTNVKAALSAQGAAPIYACRAWVNFNGTGTVAIRASGNVSSITDAGVGQYAVNFITAMQDTQYSVSGSAGNILTDEFISVKALANSYCAINTIPAGGTTPVDSLYVSAAIHR